MIDGDLFWNIQESGARSVIVRGGKGREPIPADWRERLEEAFRMIPNVMVVGAKRLTGDGKLFSMGEFVVHPKGFHSLGYGSATTLFRYPEEVDVVAGGLFAVDASAFRVARGRELLQGDLGAIHLCLKVRENGGRCVVIPDVAVVDRFVPKPEPPERMAFLKKWGFDYLAPDLEDIRDVFRNTNLLWNARFLGRLPGFSRNNPQETLSWESYDKMKPVRQRADEFVKTVKKLCSSGQVLDIGCWDGLFVHLLSNAGLEATGVDPEQTALDKATRLTGEQRYPKKPPKFFNGYPDSLPLKRDSFDVVTMLNVVEYLLNPSRALREAERVLTPGGRLLVVTPERQSGIAPDPGRVVEYTAEELTQIAQATGVLKAISLQKGSSGYRDLIAVFRK